ncbi:MAG: nucleotide disphospho-sugar-binding domain-containing protein [Acidobacteriota bacterium]
MAQGSGLWESADNSLELFRESKKLLADWIPKVMRVTCDAITSGTVVPSETVLLTNSMGLLYLGPFWLERGFTRLVCLEPYLLFDWLGRWRRERSQFLPSSLPTWIGGLLYRGLFGRHGRALVAEFLGRRLTSRFADLQSAVVAQIHTCSPQLIPEPSLATGYCYPSVVGTVSGELDAFLTRATTSSQAVVLFTIGSMNLSERDKAAMVDEFVGAIDLSNDVAGVVLGYSGPSHDSVFFQEGFVPYRAVFPRADLIVCHGGAGTAHLALHAGVPIVIVPFLKDQFDWARRLDRLGMLVDSVPRREFSAQRLATAIDGVEAETIRSACRAGETERARHGDGLDRVVEQLLAVHRQSRFWSES